MKLEKRFTKFGFNFARNEELEGRELYALD